MGRVNQDSPLYGKRGRVGPLILRQLNGETIVQAAERGPRKPRSAAQQAHLDRTHRARLYGKAQIQDPAVKALYAARITKRCTSAYTVAVQDYLNAPEITALDASGYRGGVGDAIWVRASDDFEVAGVYVRMLELDGGLREAGPASLQTNGEWLFRTTQLSLLPVGVVIEVAARDRPGNVTVERLTLKSC